MIYIGFALTNPFSRRWSMIKEKMFTISKNKTLEIGLQKNHCIVEFSFRIDDFKQNHAGFGFDFGLFGYSIDFSFYDNRHYDDK